jgi:hypothetical protein
MDTMQIGNKDEPEGLVAADALLIFFSDFVSTKSQIRLVRVKWPCHSTPIRAANQVP